MKAPVDGRVIAAIDDVIACRGYQYFPRDAVKTDWLEKTPRTADDLKCPHAVQFYDVVVEGRRHARAAWIYEAPLGAMKPTAERVGFWQDVKVG
jgi:uncharacterized protein (DUF427 family)